jgi:tetratricopeptide (TPR) repeat protein
LLIDLADRVAAHHDWQLAEKIAARAVIEKPNDFELHRRYGWYLRDQGSSRYQEAEAQFRLALKFNSADPETLGMLGGLLKRTSRYKEAIECYEKGLRLSPSTLYMRIAHTGMMLLNEIIEKREPINGQALYKQLYEDVLKDKNSQNDAWSLAVLGECSFVLGRKSESIEFFQKASRLAENPTVIESPADQIKLFGDYGFRTSDALQIVGILRVQALPVEVRSKDEHPQDTEREGEFGPLPIIVHLSDIHFGGRTDKDGSVQRMHRFFDGDYSQSLAKHLLAELVRPTGRFRLVGKPVSIVASGDLAYTATKEEFEEALVLFRILRDELKLKPEQFIFCPGNHDVDWAQSAIDKSTRFDRYLAFLRNFYGEPLFRELYPLITWDFSVDGTRPRPSDLVSTYFNREQGVLFASFNSCVYETEQHHYGFISLSQQQNIADLLDKLNVSSDVVRVAVVHHHVHPYPDFINLVGKDGHWVDMSTIRDGGLFERFLEKHNFDLVLHGHKHKPQLRETVVRDRHSHDQIKPLIVCGAGSCGVAESELEHSTGNQFQVLEVVNRKRMARAEFVRIEWRELSLDAGAEWATTRVWNVLGG